MHPISIHRLIDRQYFKKLRWHLMQDLGVETLECHNTATVDLSQFISVLLNI